MRFKLLRKMKYGLLPINFQERRHLDINGFTNLKKKSYGMVKRFKARLVICGNRQIEGINYNKTFSDSANCVGSRCGEELGVKPVGYT